MNMLAFALGMAITAAGSMAHAATHEHDLSHQPPMQPAASPTKHEGHGVLKAVNVKAGKVQIAHEAIADLGWPPMTMWFALRDPLPKAIRVGDAVNFELLQGETKQWEIVKIRHQ